MQPTDLAGKDANDALKSGNMPAADLPPLELPPSELPPSELPAETTAERPPEKQAEPLAGKSNRLLLIFSAIAFLSITYSIYSPLWTTKPSAYLKGNAPAYKIDLNKAQKAELMQMPGIGPSRADAIINKRNEVGGLQSADDIKVRGIGSKTLDGIQSHILPNPEAATPPLPSTINPNNNPPADKPTKLKPGDMPININICPELDLQRLPGVGATLAKRIFAARPIKNWDELNKVKGIGSKLIDGMKTFVVFE